MPGVLIKLPVCFDIGVFFNCSGVVGRKATAGFCFCFCFFSSFTGLMSTLGSVLIKSCRNIFTTVQRKWGYLVKLVSLYSEDLWGGGRARGMCSGKNCCWIQPPRFRAEGPVCFLSSSVLPWEVFPQLPGRGKARKAPFPCGSCFLCLSAFPVLNMSTSER